jgi:pimeloyl-ACP methyl ester carboxylesterase
MFAEYTLCLVDPSNPAQPRHIAYREWGNPANPYAVVCLHGLTRNSRDFDALAETLALRHRVICPDMAGRGKSNWLRHSSDYNYFTYLNDVNALLSHLQLNEVAWVGTSMGGIIGMMLAAQQPGRIVRMVLNDVGAIVSAQGLSRILGYAGAQSSFANASDAMAYLKSTYASFALSMEEDWQRFFDASLTPLPDGRYAVAYDPDLTRPLKEAAEEAETIADVDLSLFWNAVQCPVLILRGTQSDILTRATAQAMCKRPPLTKLIEIQDTGHAPALLDPKQIRIVVDWLD